MARTGKIRRKSEEDTELNMVPIMNMFMVLIPFLLMSASFISIKAINTSVPVHASTSEKNTEKASDVKVTVMLALGEKDLCITAAASGLSAAQLSEMEETISMGAGLVAVESKLKETLKNIKTRYPKSDTIVLVPDASILYDDIIRTMDMARNIDQSDLFPNVVLSGSLG
jgi:biopolymer transport protein ExbD